MMKARSLFIILFTQLALFIPFEGSSQQQPDSLLHYLDIAAKNNPTILQRYFEYEAALMKTPQAGSLPNPELSVGVFLSPMELVGGAQLADIRLMQMFPWFGVLRSARDEMSLMANATYESFRDARLQVIFDVQKTWYEMYKVKQDIHISEKNLDILRSIERLAISRFSASSSGKSGLEDVYRVQIEIGDIQNNIELLKNQWNTLASRFNSYLDRAPDSEIILPDSLVVDTSSPILLSISDSILLDNPMLGMIRYKQQSLDARIDMVGRMSYPMFGLGINYSLISKSDMSVSPMNGKDMIMPMLTVSLPVYRKKYKAMEGEANLLKSATIQNYEASVNDLLNEYYEAVQLYQDAKRRIKLYSDQYQLASKSLDLLLVSYASSGTDLTDVLRIQQQVLDYEYKKVEAVADYNTAAAWLHRLIGL